MGTYRLDGLNLSSTYGVKVQQSAGNLDMLERKGTTAQDWLDEDGEDEYVLTNDIWFKPRDIRLNCRIIGNTTTLMLSQLNALKAVLESPGLHTLYIGNTGVTHSIYFKAGAKVRNLVKWGVTGKFMASFMLNLREPDPSRQ